MPFLLFMAFFLGSAMEVFPQSAHSFYLKTSSSSPSYSQDSLAIETAIDQSKKLHRNEHDEEEEYKLAEQAISRSIELGDTLLYAKSLDNLGLLYRYHQRYDEAVPLHAKAYKLLEKQKSAKLPKMIYANNAGVASRYGEDFDMAVYYYLEALKIAEEENDLRNIAISCNGLGNTLIYLPGREEDALAYFERSLEAENKRNNSLGVAMNYLSIGDYFTEQGKYEKAREYLDKLLEINISRKDTFGLGITYEYFGQNFFLEGKDLDKAQKYFELSKELFVKLGDLHKQADLTKREADIFRQKGQINLAEENYLKAWEMAEKIKSKGLIQDASYWLYIIHEQRGEHQKALAYFKISENYRDSLALMDQETQIAAIEKRFAIEKKESQIELLEKDKDLQQAQLDNQFNALKSHRLVLILMVILLFTIITITVLQFRNIKAKKKANDLLIAQNHRISEQKDQIEQVNQQLEETFEELIQEQRHSEEKRIKLLESKFENRIQSLALQSLESQMNPHFLFNGMNAVRWLVMKNKNEEAKEYIDTFARLLRMSLTNNRKKAISLAEELESTNLYLKIERLRFDGEFTYQTIISPEVRTRQVLVPPKILQPVVENAIKHGLLPSRNPQRKLIIEVQYAEGQVTVSVIDNGLGFGSTRYAHHEPKPDGTHLGLKLIEERLVIFNQQHADQVSFHIKANLDSEGQVLGTIAEIKISFSEAFDTV